MSGGFRFRGPGGGKESILLKLVLSTSEYKTASRLKAGGELENLLLTKPVK
jgi:hypothetical protein